MLGKIIKVLLVVVVLGIFGWTFYFLYSKSKKEPEKITTVQPSIQTIIQKTVATGAINPRREVAMKSQVSGIVEKLFIKAGDKVRQGDVIARVKIIPNMLNLSNAENRLNQAKIAVDNAKIEYERLTQLYKDKVISAQEYQTVNNRYQTANEELDAAQNSLQLIKEGTSAKQGSVTNTLIKSTISGMVLDVPVKEGNSVIESNTFNEGTTIASVADMGEMIFVGKVDESEVGKIHVGMPLILTIGALQEDKFEAKLEYISPKGVTENGAIQFEIKAAVDLKEGKFLRAGYSANADIILSRKDSVLSVPESVLTFEGQKVFVEIETAPGKLEKKEIKTGLSDGIQIQVKEGLTGKENIKTPTLSQVPDK
ncbi:MAG TPA: efflux RND transporter periplasmic adaptor subunit [Chitinophagales bacterium]|nr:efflux RND transporter periplasmic adaptor subunit [Chitinophagales bacterium]